MMSCARWLAVAASSIWGVSSLYAGTPASNYEPVGGVPFYSSIFNVLDTDPVALTAQGWQLLSLSGSTLLFEKAPASRNVGERVACHIRPFGYPGATGLPAPPKSIGARCIAVGTVRSLATRQDAPPGRQATLADYYKPMSVRFTAKGLSELLSDGWMVQSLSLSSNDWIAGEWPGEATALLRRTTASSSAVLCSLTRRTIGVGNDWSSMCIEILHDDRVKCELTSTPTWSETVWHPLDLSLNEMLAEGLRVNDIATDRPDLRGSSARRISGHLVLSHAGRRLNLICDFGILHGVPPTSSCGGFVPRVGPAGKNARQAPVARAFDAQPLAGPLSAQVARGFRPALMRLSGDQHGGQWYVLERAAERPGNTSWAVTTAVETALCVQSAEILPLESGRIEHSPKEEKGSCLSISIRAQSNPRPAIVNTVMNNQGSASRGFGSFSVDRLPDAGEGLGQLLAAGHVPIDLRLHGNGTSGTMMLDMDRSVAICKFWEDRSHCRLVKSTCSATLAGRQAALLRALFSMPRRDSSSGSFVVPRGDERWTIQAGKAWKTLADHEAKSAAIPECDFRAWLSSYRQALAALPVSLPSASANGSALAFNPDAEARGARAQLDAYFSPDRAFLEASKPGIEAIGEAIAGERQRQQFRWAPRLLKALDWSAQASAVREQFDLVQLAKKLDIPSADVAALLDFDAQLSQEFQLGQVGRNILDACGDDVSVKEPYTAFRCRVFYPALAERFARQLAQRIGARDALDPNHPMYFRKLLCRLQAQTVEGCSAAACQFDFLHVRGSAASGNCIPD